MTSTCWCCAEGEIRQLQHKKYKIQFYVHQYDNLSVPFTDAFMDFTSGILSVTGINATGHIFASYPARHLSILGGFIDQVSSSSLWPNDPQRRSQSDSKYHEILANAANATLIGPVGLRTPPRLLSLGSNDPFPGIHWKAKSILKHQFPPSF